MLETHAHTLCGPGGDLATESRDNASGSEARGSLTPIAPPRPSPPGPPASCGGLRACHGPCAACSAAAALQVHVESCVHDLCAMGGSRETLCAAQGAMPGSPSVAARPCGPGEPGGLQWVGVAGEGLSQPDPTSGPNATSRVSSWVRATPLGHCTPRTLPTDTLQ